MPSPGLSSLAIDPRRIFFLDLPLLASSHFRGTDISAVGDVLCGYEEKVVSGLANGGGDRCV